MLSVLTLEQIKDKIKEYSYKENFENPFTLASGKRSPYYLDLKQVLLQPLILKSISFHLLEKIKKDLSFFQMD